MLANPRHVQFVVEYMKDGNASRAALAVGYKSPAAGTHLLRQYAVAAEVEKQMEMMRKAARVSKAYVVSKLVDVAERTMQEVKPIMIKDEQGKLIESGEFEFDSGGANRSLELLGKTLGIFTEKTVTVTMTLAELVEQSMAQEKPIDPSSGNHKVLA